MTQRCCISPRVTMLVIRIYLIWGNSTYSTFRFDRRFGGRSPQLNWAGRRWVHTFKRRFCILRRCLPLAEPVCADHVQAKAGAGPIFGTFFLPLSRRLLFETTQILEPFWFFLWTGEPHQVTTFFTVGSITLQCKFGQKKNILWLSADETKS